MGFMEEMVAEWARVRKKAAKLFDQACEDGKKRLILQYPDDAKATIVKVTRETENGYLYEPNRTWLDALGLTGERFIEKGSPLIKDSYLG
jgi:hypothetical protein